MHHSRRGCSVLGVAITDGSSFASPLPSSSPCPSLCRPARGLSDTPHSVVIASKWACLCGASCSSSLPLALRVRLMSRALEARGRLEEYGAA
jgi:hypothetical protein